MSDKLIEWLEELGAGQATVSLHMVPWISLYYGKKFYHNRWISYIIPGFLKREHSNRVRKNLHWLWPSLRCLSISFPQYSFGQKVRRLSWIQMEGTIQRCEYQEVHWRWGGCCYSNQTEGAQRQRGIRFGMIGEGVTDRLPYAFRYSENRFDKSLTYRLVHLEWSSMEIRNLRKGGNEAIILTRKDKML